MGRILLSFIAGALLGANLMYYAVGHGWLRAPGRVAAADAAVATPAPVPAPVDAGPMARRPAPQAARGDGDGGGIVPPASRPAARPDSAPAPAASHAPPAASPEPASRPVAAAPAPGRGPRGLMMPVMGVVPAQLVDTFSDARSQDRVHDAIDIMAERGTPVVSATDGTVAKLFTSKLGGLTVYVFGPDQAWVYYYAHLDRYATGLSEGQRLKRGQVIGYVGSSGNASPDAPHLHFEVSRLGPEKHWWQARPVNPYPLLGGRPH